jgi:citrate synthase
MKQEVEYMKAFLIRFIGYQIKRSENDYDAENTAKLYLKDNLFDIQRLQEDSKEKEQAVRDALWYNKGKDLHKCPVSVDSSS